MYTAIVFLPLLGAIIAGFGRNKFSARSLEILTTSVLMIAAILSWIAFVNYGIHDNETSITLFNWMNSGSLDVSWEVRIDGLTAVMLVVVNTVSALVHLYSIGYMSHDPDRPRFFAYLSLFTFAMLMLVTSNNLVQLFFGWEGVGLASYLLIGFWFKKNSATNAAIKAFVVNRVGDFGFALGIFTIFALLGTVQFDEIAARVGELSDVNFTFLWIDADALTLISILLFIGAMGKSAQFLLHTWLPDAMEGPTPVSALIHAATMVTAGVFMVARLNFIFAESETALMIITLVGGITAFFAASVGLVQNDIKRVIAYSTCSQLGYMFVALGVGAYPVAVFHLFTHAFFKALLFLGAGSVIHAVSDEQDMRNMGGLRKVIPKTYIMMLIGTFAITGVGIPLSGIGLAGFISKDAIIEAAFAGHGNVAELAFILLVIAAAMTSFYSWRLIFLTFHGKPRAPQEVMDHAHESPPVMLVPLYVLAFGAVVAGVLGYPYFVGEHSSHHAFDHFWGSVLPPLENMKIMSELHEVPKWVKVSPFAMMLLGFIIAYILYIRKPDLPERIKNSQQGLYNFLLNKWYFDEAYNYLFVRPAFSLGRFLWQKGDVGFIDKYGPNGIAHMIGKISNYLSKLQSGFLYHYAFAMLIGVAILATWLMASSN